MTKYTRIFLGLFVVSALTATATPAPNNKTFDKIRALEGRWEGQRSDGQTVKIDYQVHADGSAVLETVTPPDHDTMLTVYHMDGENIRMTHYCVAKNQPRMKSKSVSADGKVVSFEFVDATNLASPSDGHMHNLEITFIDRDHIRQKWTWLENGRTQDSVFELRRVE